MGSRREDGIFKTDAAASGDATLLFPLSFPLVPKLRLGHASCSPKLQLRPRRSGEGSQRSTTFAHSPTQVPAKSGGAWRASSKRSFADKGVPKLELRNEGLKMQLDSGRGTIRGFTLWR